MYASVGAISSTHAGAPCLCHPSPLSLVSEPPPRMLLTCAVACLAVCQVLCVCCSVGGVHSLMHASCCELRRVSEVCQESVCAERHPCGRTCMLAQDDPAVPPLDTVSRPYIHTPSKPSLPACRQLATAANTCTQVAVMP